jgi:Xaa-Pro aminopeptidase
MLDRRHFLLSAGAAAAALPAEAALAQAAPSAQRSYGFPAGTRPFAPDVYRARRERLMAAMKTGVAVIFGPQKIDHAATIGPVDSIDQDFAYLTGIVDEPGAALVLAPRERRDREFLLLPPVNPETDRWEGTRLLLGETLRSRTGFERIRRTNSLGGMLTDLAARSGELRYLGPLAGPDSPVPRDLELYGRVAARVPGTAITNSHGLVRALRMVKEPRELELMRRAVAATERGMRAAMRAARPGMSEYELRHIIESEFRAAGARGLAFPSIVATARNSAVLHYGGSDHVIQPGDMILCDIGAAVDHYASDITRSFPADGRFSPEQRRVYETVLAAQEAAAAKLRAGAYYEDLQEAAREVVARAGHGDDSWHGLGHFVGLDVHDVGDYAAPLPAGAVLTIEPGIYLPHREFGVRIEDQYLVTAAGSEHMSRTIPRTVAEIEAEMAKG